MGVAALRTGDAGEDPFAVPLDVEIHALLRQRRVMRAGLGPDRCPAGAERAAVGAEDERHARRVGVVPAHGLRQVGILRDFKAAVRPGGRMHFVHLGQGRAIDIFQLLCNAGRPDKEHA